MYTTLDLMPITRFKGVGKGIASKFAKLGINTVQDVLFHLPFRYQDRTRLTPIGAAQLGSEVVIEGEVVACDVIFRRRRSLLCILQDDTGSLSLRFFHFSNAQKNHLVVGTRLRCFGEVRRGAAGLELYHPEYQLLGRSKPLEASLTPIYPATTGVTQPRIRSMVDQALDLLESGEILPELLPQFSMKRDQPGIIEAIKYVHRPPVDAPVDMLTNGMHSSQRRLAFEELLAHHLSLQKIRTEVRQHEAYSLSDPSETYRSLLASLPYELTRAQQKVSQEIARDMQAACPMLRLLQGDVGSGKTVVAALAALHATENGLQSALMAPTEILAEQHFINLSTWLIPLGIKTAWLSGKVKGKARSEQLGSIAMGSADVVIGTHALFQEEVRFSKLGLVIIDEQHRFGVHQRMALREKGIRDDIYPHQLIMTATPIPRTLAMSIYADLDISIIDELPPGRSPVTTSAIPDDRRNEVMERVASACREGRQAYWVCTLIVDSESLQWQAAEATAQQLASSLPHLNIGLVHGRMSSSEKATAMAAFKQRKIDVLVATTVIEVGVDIPNASLMIIENPERLGLSQLHQLRGRVGRSSVQSHCVLLYQQPLSETAKKRLAVIRSSNDGFFIAQADLELRGPGDVLGTRQTGEINFRIADLMRDSDLLGEVAKCAAELARRSPASIDPLLTRWLSRGEELGSV